MILFHRRNLLTVSGGLVRAVLCISLLMSAGCFPLPVRSPTRTTDKSGGPIDLTFLKAGSTTRDEVTGKLASIDTGTMQREFFWGRLRISKYRDILMVGYVPVGPLDRKWGVQNILVGYDQRGIVKSWTIVNDKKLLDHLDLMSNGASALLDLSSPVLVNSVVYRLHERNAPSGVAASTQLTLEAQSLECFGVRIARRELRTIALGNSNEPDRLLLKMVFDHQIDFSNTQLRKRTDHIDLTVDPPALLLLRSYLKQTPPPSKTDSSATKPPSLPALIRGR
jgi:hypothetical protein